MNICPACGYPMYGPGLCPFCLPIQAITDDLTFQPVFSAVNSPSPLPSPPGGMRDPLEHLSHAGSDDSPNRDAATVPSRVVPTTETSQGDANG